MDLQRKLTLLMTLLILTTGALTAQSRQKKQMSLRKGLNESRMSILRMWKLTEYLEMTEKQGEKVFPAVRAHQTEMSELNQSRRELVIKFIEKVQNDEASTKETEAYIKAVEAVEKSLLSKRTKHLRAMKSILNEKQYARYVIFDDHFKGQIRKQLERSPRGGKRRKPGDGPGMMPDHWIWFHRF